MIREVSQPADLMDGISFGKHKSRKCNRRGSEKIITTINPDKS